MVNNHRIMIRNARLRDHTIHNLSKFASARGLREMLVFKIGYEHKAESARQMFNKAYAKIAEDKEIEIEVQHSLEVYADNTGDYAITWKVFYYTKNIKKLVRTRQAFMEIIIQCAEENNISFATPVLYQKISAE